MHRELSPTVSDLLSLQRRSFARFLQADTSPEEREETGLHEVFRSVFPLKNIDQTASLDYISYTLERPRYNEEECLSKDLTYAAPIKVVIRLLIWESSDARATPASIRDIKEQEMYFGEIPLLTTQGTLIINGVERVVTPRLTERRGVYFSREKEGFSAKIPDRHGNALVLTLQKDGLLSAALSLLPGAPASAFMEVPGVLRTLYLEGEERFSLSFEDRPQSERTASEDILAPTGEVLVRRGQKLTINARKKLRAAGCLGVPVSPKALSSLICAEDVLAGWSGAPLLRQYEKVGSAKRLGRLFAEGVSSFPVYCLGETPKAPEPVTLRDADALLEWFFREAGGFFVLSFSTLALLREALGLAAPEPGEWNLSGADLQAVVAHLSALQKKEISLADANRPGPFQVQAVGEQLAQQCWVGLQKMAEKIRHQLCNVDVYTYMPHDFINAKPLVTTLRRFLESSACPPVEQTNPLSMLNHLRRLALERGTSRPQESWARPAAGGLPGQGERAEEISLALGAEVDDSGLIEWSDAERPESLPEALLPLRALDTDEEARRGALALCQAQTLLRPEAPLVMTGQEAAAARALRTTLHAERAGEVVAKSDAFLLVRHEEESRLRPDVYRLLSPQRARQGTPSFLTPAVKEGEQIEEGRALTEGPFVREGALALGSNAKVTFVEEEESEGGIIVSEDAVRAGLFTALEWQELECVFRDTRLGAEELTATPPGVAAAALRHLGADGIVTRGAHVRPGDVLVGKKVPIRPVEKKDDPWFEDASLRVPPGGEAVVRHVAILTRLGMERCASEESYTNEKIQVLEAERDQVLALIQETTRRRALTLLEGEVLSHKVLDDKGNILLARGERLTRERLSSFPIKLLYGIETDKEDTNQKLRALFSLFEEEQDTARWEYQEKIERAKYKRNELPPGVIRVVRVILERTRALAVGDILADRHGMQGTVTRILPGEEMPSFSHGEGVDVLLPLAKATAGTLAEARLGWAASRLGRKLVLPQSSDFRALERKFLMEAEISEDGKSDILWPPAQKGASIEAPPHRRLPAGILYLMRLRQPTGILQP